MSAAVRSHSTIQLLTHVHTFALVMAFRAELDGKHETSHLFLFDRAENNKLSLWAAAQASQQICSLAQWLLLYGTYTASLTLSLDP